MIEAHIRALEQSTMMALTLFASQSKQIIINILDLKDILGFYCGIKVVIQCQIVDFTLSQYIVIRIAIRPCLSQYIAIHFLVAIPIPNVHPPQILQGFSISRLHSPAAIRHCRHEAWSSCEDMGRLQRSHMFAIFPAKKNKLAGKRAQK